MNRLNLSIFISVLIVAACTTKQNRTWKVLTMGSTTEIKPAVSQHDLVSYILTQTHEPLFHYDQDHRVTSRILEKWSRSDDYKSFTLCPKKDVKFDESQQLNNKDLERVIADTWKKETQYISKEENACLLINFKEPHKNFYEILSNLSKAPTRPTKDPHIEVGLGPFKAVSLSNEEIVLVRKTPDARKKFDKIIFKNIETMTPEQINDRSIQDFNMVTQSKLPDWVPLEYSNYPVASLEEYILLINHPDLRVRKAIYNCLNVNSVRKAYFHTKVFHEVGSLFPTGIRGAIPSKVSQKCEVGGQIAIKKPLIFANWRPEHKEDLIKLFSDFRQKTGLVVVPENITLAEMTHKLIDLHSGYDLMIVSVKNEQAQMSDFLEVFADPSKRVLSFGFHTLESKYRQMIELPEGPEQDKLGAEISAEVLAKALALPLFQPVTQTFYPKNLKSVQFGSTFNEYPEVDNIQ